MFQYEVHETFIQVGDLYAACCRQQLEFFLYREDRIAEGDPQFRFEREAVCQHLHIIVYPCFQSFLFCEGEKGFRISGRDCSYIHTLRFTKRYLTNSRSMICCCSLSRLIFSFITFSAMAIERSAISERTSRIAFSFSSRIRRAASSTCKRVSAAAFR